MKVINLSETNSVVSNYLAQLRDITVQGNRNLAVSKGFDFAVTQVDAQLLTNGFCEFRIGISGEDLDVISVRNHD